MKIDAHIARAEQELKTWIAQLRRLDPPERFDQEYLNSMINPSSIGPDGLRAGYVIYSLLRSFSKVALLEATKVRLLPEKPLVVAPRQAAEIERVLIDAGWHDINVGRQLVPAIKQFIGDFYGNSENIGLPVYESFDLEDMVEITAIYIEAASLENAFFGETMDISPHHWHPSSSEMFQDLAEFLEDRFVWNQYAPFYKRLLASQGIYSWLVRSFPDEFHTFKPLITPMLKELSLKANHISEQIERLYGQLDDRGGLEDGIQIVQRLQEALDNYDGSYANVAEDILESVYDAVFEGSAGSLVGLNQPLNIIPSDGNEGKCCEIALVLSRGGSGKQGFTDCMRQLRAHLIHCVKITKVVIICMDQWVPGKLEESRRDIKAYQDLGIIFIPILVTKSAMHVLEW